MQLLNLEAAGIIAWSNSKKNNCYFVTGSHADTPNAEGLLQLFTFDIMNKQSSSNCLGKAKHDKTSFSSLSWDVFGETGAYPYGVIAGGMKNGMITLWDPNQIAQYQILDNNSPDLDCLGLLSQIEVSSSAVETVEFNPHKTNLIACGGDEVTIMDITKGVENPEFFAPGGEGNVHGGSPITCVSWNKKVSHILASASENGLTAIWDLKVNQSVFSFSDNAEGLGARKVRISWNPEIPTQLAVVYDDERYPEFQIWDLRNPQGPVSSISGHNSGIHTIDWCMNDPSLILTGGRDKKAIIWNYKTGDIIMESEIDTDFSQAVWSQKLPDIYSVTSASGDTQVFSMNNEAEKQLKDYAPKWLKPPVGARFSFDGRLIVFSEKTGGLLKEYHVKEAEKDIETIVEEFANDMKMSDIKELCDKKSVNHHLTEVDKTEWNYIKAMKSDDMTEIIKVLGFNRNEIIKQAEDYTGKSHRKKEEEPKGQKQQPKSNVTFIPLDASAADDFFNDFTVKQTKKNLPVTKEVKLGSSAILGEEKEIFVQNEPAQKNTNWNAGHEKLIKQNILIGNIEGAVDCALKCGRFAEALALAYTKGHEFFTEMVKTYFTQAKEPFLKNVLKNLVEDEINEQLVLSYNVSEWKECVALCATQSEGVEFRKLMNSLADRLIKEKKDEKNAILCYILGRNFNVVLETYLNKYVDIPRNSKERIVYLFKTFEKVLAMKSAMRHQETNLNFDSFIYEIAVILQQYDKGDLALEVIALADMKNIEIMRFRDRIWNSRKDFPSRFPAYNFPYSVDLVGAKGKPKPKETVGAKPNISKGPLTTFKNDGRGPMSPPEQTSQPKHIGFPGPGQHQPGPGPKKPDIFNPGNVSHNTGLVNPPPSIGGTRPNMPPPNKPFVPAPVTTSPPQNTNYSHPPEKKQMDLPPPQPTTVKQPLRQPAPNMPPPTNTVRPPTTTQPMNPTPTQTLPPPPISSGPPTTQFTNQPVSSPSYTPEETKSATKPITSAPIQRQPGPGLARPPGPTSNPMTNPGFTSGPPSTTIPQPKIGGPPMRQPAPTNRPPTPTQNTQVQSQSYGSNAGGQIDLSSVPSIHKPIVDSISRVLPILDQIEKNPKRRADLDSKISTLFLTLTNNTLSPETIKNLNKLCSELDKDNEDQAMLHYQQIIKSDWDTNKDWLMVLKRLITKK